jgi:hypothetical protein
MISVNKRLIDTFPTSEKNLKATAYLIDLEEKYRWDFLYLPEQTRFDIEARYNEVPTSCTTIPDQQYLYTSGVGRQYDDLMLIGYDEGKSVQEHIEKLFAAMKPDVANKKYEPPILQFIWGNYKIPYCRLTSVRGSNSNVLNGLYADARISITLVECRQPTLGSDPTVLGEQVVNTQVAPQQVRQRDINALISKVRKTVETTPSPLRTQAPRFQYRFNQVTRQVEVVNRQNRTVLTSDTEGNVSL